MLVIGLIHLLNNESISALESDKINKVEKVLAWLDYGFVSTVEENSEKAHTSYFFNMVGVISSLFIDYTILLNTSNFQVDTFRPINFLEAEANRHTIEVNVKI